MLYLRYFNGLHMLMETYKEKISYITGFTLIELLVTITIVGILASIGLPSFSQTIRNNRLTTNINEFVTSMSFARNEAVKRNQGITVLRNGAQWESGWIVFTDLNENGALDVPSIPPAATDDTLLRTYGALPANYTLRSTANLANRITYQSAGLINGLGGTYVLCENSDGNNIPEANTARVLIINNVGRTRMGGDNDNNFIPERNNALNVLTDITSCVSPFN